nr:intradiol ring-cleavage dioxygenase [Kineosporia rhizophila]
MLGGLGAVFLLGACGSNSDETSTAGSTTSTGVTEIESETNGPYPADGTNGIDVRTESGIVRSDITSSFGDSTTTAEGVPLTIEFTVTDLTGAPLSGAAVYVWHCDRAGLYSLYSEGITEENYLRGIQETDANGVVSFTSIFPACYTGRWPHIHFEVYSSLEDATSGEGTIRKTSQMALPEEVNAVVYATDGYSASVSNMSQVTLEDDNVFGDDDAATELGTVTGSVSKGYVAKLTAAIDPEGTDAQASGGGQGGGTPPSGGPGEGGTPPSGAPSGGMGTPPSGAPQPTASASS